MVHGSFLNWVETIQIVFKDYNTGRNKMPEEKETHRHPICHKSAESEEHFTHGSQICLQPRIWAQGMRGPGVHTLFRSPDSLAEILAHSSLHVSAYSSWQIKESACYCKNNAKAKCGHFSPLPYTKPCFSLKLAPDSPLHHCLFPLQTSPCFSHRTVSFSQQTRPASPQTSTCFSPQTSTCFSPTPESAPPSD